MSSIPIQPPNSIVTFNKIYRTSLLNIDSSLRNINPKNICNTTNINKLPTNCLQFNKDSNIITINYPNHNLNINDNIVIQNVEGFTKILMNAFYLINNFNYLIIDLDNNYINKDYQTYNYTDNLYINIELINNNLTTYYIDNSIPFNYIIGIKNIKLLTEINKNIINSIANILFNIFSINDITLLYNRVILIQLPYSYNSNTNDYYIINTTLKISYLHIGGIDIGYINSDYPINNINFQSHQIIYNIIDKNNIQIKNNNVSFITINAGGSNIRIFKIINTIEGYPDADNYIINLKKSFNNVINIELVSTEFPYIDNIIKKNINDKLYWKNIEDFSYIYSIQLDEGYYNITTLLNQLKTKMNSLPRINNNNITNYFDITLDQYIHIITFSAYNLITLPNCLSIRNEIINLNNYYILDIIYPYNMVEVGDTITISSSNEVTIKNNINDNNYQILSISNNYINTNHLVYSINKLTNTFSIILGEVNNIITNIVTYLSNGGKNIQIKSKTNVSFLFDKPDTIGDILGFKNVGNLYSVTDYKSIITNQDSYIYNNKLNSVGNIIEYNNGFINLSGINNYILMYLNEIEYIYNNNLQSAFAKILLSGNPGDLLFNTFVQYPSNIYCKIFPISILTDINVKFLYSNGSRVNFKNLNHSFTLKIVEEIIQNNDTYINSNSISIYK